ncbi:DUF4279 domain-containing protein [Nocardia neocaledoniensis]|uniref:DUF4279 domain-containing protein n=1 Tax=Nocardia neocaledoniensis TaxID=236511 RepID=UPI0033C4570F
MKVVQYSYFTVYSDTMAASTMTERLGIDPDEVAVLGSRSVAHRIPRSHRWKLVRRGSESIDEQLEQLVDRLEPIRHQLTSLRSEPGVHASMHVVRYYGDPDGVHGAPDGTPLAECQDWPRPLGWHLSHRVMEFLGAIGAELDIDEYDLTVSDVDDSEQPR